MNLGPGLLGGWLDNARALSFDEPNIQDSDLAFIQYTSGSTGEPNGVMVTFQALSANVKLIHNSFHKTFEVDDGLRDHMVGFSWLPLYHDLGLIFAALAQFLGGWRMHYMSPLAFLKHPLRWLELISANKCSWSLAPDFAYGLVTRKFKEAQLARHCLPSLDLSCVYYMLDGTEPIRPGFLKAFYKTFSAYGLRQNWFHAGYGLAEHVVGVCWMSGYRNSRKNPKLVAVGNNRTLDDSLDCRIVDPQTCTECPNETIGELWISSPSVAAGYWGKEALTESVFRARLMNRKDGSSALTFLRTGDLAFVEDDHIYICGRIKDLIIIGGRNYYPQDVELATQEADICVRPGCVAAFCLRDTESDGEVAVVFEVRSSLLTGSLGQLRNVIANVRSAVAQTTGISLTRIVVISEGSIPKTTSGKIQRKASREALESEKLEVVFDVHFGDVAMLSAAEVHAPGNGQFDMPVQQSSTTAAALSTGAFHSPLEICSTFGVFDMTCTLPENGLDSMRQIELLKQLRQCCDLNISFYKALTVPIGGLLSREDCGMGNDIRQLSEDEVRAIGLDPSSLEVRRGAAALKGGIIKREILDSFAVFVLLCLIAASVSFVLGTMWESSFYIPIPVCYGLWCLTYSILVFVAKWVLIGQYTETHVPFGSIGFYRWWLVDRLVHIWEMFVGNYIFGTCWLWLFYKLLGADLPRGCHVQTYLREFDLVSVGSLKGEEEEERRGGRMTTTVLRGQVRGSRMVLGAIRLAQVRIEEGAKLHPDAWVVPQLLSVNEKGEDFSTRVESSDARYCRCCPTQKNEMIPPPQTQWGEALQMWISPLVVVGVLSVFHSHLLASCLEEGMLASYSSRRVKVIASAALLPLMSLFMSRFLCSVGGNVMSISIGAFFAPFNHIYALVVNYGPLTVWVYRLFGARIGKYSIITELGLASPVAMKHLSIGDRCTVGKSFLDPFYVGVGSKIPPGILMEDDSSIGLLANVAGGVRVGHSSVVTIGSRVGPGCTIPPESNWYAHYGGSSGADNADGIVIPGLTTTTEEEVGGGRMSQNVISISDRTTASNNNNSAIIYSVCVITVLLRVGFLVAGVAGYLTCVDALSAGLSTHGASLGIGWKLFCFFHLFVIWSTVYTIAVLSLFVRLSIMLNKESGSLFNHQDYLRIIIYCSKMSIDYAKAYICLIIDATIWRVWLLRIMGVEVEDVSSVMHYMSRVHDGGVVKKGAVLDNARCINHALVGQRLIFGREPTVIGKNCVLGPGSMAVMTNVPDGTVCDVRSVSIGDFSDGEEHSSTLCFVSGSPIAPIAVLRKKDEDESESAAARLLTNGHGNIDEMIPKKQQHAISNGVRHMKTGNILRKRNVN